MRNYIECFKGSIRTTIFWHTSLSLCYSHSLSTTTTTSAHICLSALSQSFLYISFLIIFFYSVSYRWGWMRNTFFAFISVRRLKLAHIIVFFGRWFWARYTSFSCKRPLYLWFYNRHFPYVSPLGEFISSRTW